MLNKKKFKCPLCDKKYDNKQSLYDHLEKEHKEQLGKLSPANFFFNMYYKKNSGKCVICGLPTIFNERIERYERLCSRPQCKEKYIKMFKERMKRKYGKEHLLNIPEQQKKMLINRKISGYYKENGFDHAYTGSYEKKFLEFLDLVLNYPPEGIICPAPIEIYYQYKDETHFYIPDFFLVSLDLLIEIKAFTNTHYRERDIEQENAKDDAANKYALENNLRYLKLPDNKFNLFLNFLYNNYSN